MKTALKKSMTFVAAALTAGMVLIPATPASASTLYGSYFNGVTGKFEGSYSYIDCRGCGNDGSVVVSNVKNGYPVRVRLYANGYRYLNQYLPDGTRGKFPSGYPPVGAKIRLEICTLNSSYSVVGYCDNSWTTNKTYS